MANVVTVQQADLCRGVVLASSFCERSSNIPIISSLLFRVSPEGMTVTGTDLEVAVTAPIAARADSSFQFCLPGSKLAAYTKLLDDVELKIEKLPNSWVQISHARGTAKIPALAPEGFPQLEAMPADHIGLPVKDLLASISRVMVTVDTAETAPVRCGSLADPDGEGLAFVSTDGHRLTLYRMKRPGLSLAAVVIPTAGLNAILRVGVACGLEELRYATGPADSEGRAMQFFEGGRYLVQTRNIVGNFPPYKKILPSAFVTEMILDRLEFAGAVKRTISLLDSESRTVRFMLSKGSLSIEARTAEKAESDDPIAVDYDGDETGVAFNGKYVADFLKTAFTEKIVFRFGGPKAPSEFAEFESDSRYVVMPMRL